MLEEHHHIILETILTQLADLQEPWALTGSCGMALQGMPLEVHDIDLQTTMKGTFQILEMLGGKVLLPVIYKASEKIRSYFGALELDGVRIEIMGDMQKLLPDESWENLPDLETIRTWVRLQERQVPVLPLEYEATAYRLMGREERARQIREYLQQTGLKPE